MNFNELSKRVILDEVYDTKLPYPKYRKKPTAKDNVMKDKHNADHSRLIDLFVKHLRLAMDDAFGRKLTDKEFEVIYKYANEEGHSDGINEVMNCAEDIVNLVKDFMEAKNGSN